MFTYLRSLETNIFQNDGKNGTEKDEDPFKQSLKVWDMRSISIKKHEMEIQ